MEKSVHKLWEALEESVKLQAHYAKLLNDFDGGRRVVFKGAEEWLDRLDFLEEERAKTARTLELRRKRRRPHG